MMAPDVQHFMAERAQEGSAGGRARERPGDVLMVGLPDDDEAERRSSTQKKSPWSAEGGGSTCTRGDDPGG
jgi:hypothetical protein